MRSLLARKNKFGKLELLLGFLLFSVTSFAQSIPARPSPQRLVNNLSNEFPNFISAEEEKLLEKKLEDFSNETTNQICIIITDSLWGYAVSDFAERIITGWGVGLKEKNNGVVIVIKPTGGPGERDAFIGTGYGIEGAITDVACKRIVDDDLIPNFKNGNNYQALEEATTDLMAMAKGEYHEKDTRRRQRVDGGYENTIKYIIIGIVILIILARFFRGGGGGGGYMYTGRGWSSGGWSSGGSSGGGWGGFGGGSGGGGGAGGKW